MPKCCSKYEKTMFYFNPIYWNCTISEIFIAKKKKKNILICVSMSPIWGSPCIHVWKHHQKREKKSEADIIESFQKKIPIHKIDNDCIANFDSNTIKIP